MPNKDRDKGKKKKKNYSSLNALNQSILYLLYGNENFNKVCKI